jgi:hypothetical protein
VVGAGKAGPKEVRSFESSKLLIMEQKRHKPEEFIRLLLESGSNDPNHEAFRRQKQSASAVTKR